MSSKRFVDHVNANLIGKKIARAFVHDVTGLPRLVFSDGACVECGAAVQGDIGIGYRPYPTLTTAESLPVEKK